LALIPKKLYYYIFPIKDFLPAKDNTLELIILAHKIFVQVLMNTLDLSMSSNGWVFTVANLCFEALKIGFFAEKLPLYSFKALQSQGWLLITKT